MTKKQEPICPIQNLHWPVSAQVGGGVIHGETKHITPTGAFIRCRNPLRLNEVFDMVINAPNKPLNVQAEVVWTNTYGHDDEVTPRGMGVRFLRISEEDKRLIAHESGQYAIGKAACDFLDTLELEIGEN